MGWLSDQLKAGGDAFFSAPYLRDFQHASLTFTSANYAYAPKYKFNFHVYFNLNLDHLGSFGQFPQDQNFGLAVKSIQLPKFNFDLHTMNQYNRKRIVQSKIKYDPVNITFHDDNNNLIRKMWYNYYSYHYKDPSQFDSGAVGIGGQKPGNDGAAPVALNERTQYANSISGADDWGYVGEPAIPGQVKTPFFRSINIYGFNQHNFALYKLINPTIESFGHDTYNYAENSVMENQMAVQFETVKYYEGALNGKNPGQVVHGFGDSDHYDLELSPIARPGSNATIMGEGGLVDAGAGIMDDLEDKNWLGALQKAGATYKTFKGKDLGKLAKQEALNAAGKYATGAIKGLRNDKFRFPSAQSSEI